MSHTSKQPVSGLSSIKRDFSANTQIVKMEPVPAAKSAAKKSMLSDAMRRAIEQGVASRDTSTSISTVLPQKRPTPSHPAPEVQPVKRRQLPDSWSSSSSSTSSAPRTLSSTPTLPSTSSFNRLNLSVGSSSGSFTLSEQKPLVVPATQSSKAATRPAAIFLSKEQKAILKLVEQGENIFYTGSAGTGKSVLLREIIKVLQMKHVKSADAVAVTASTGIAACNIGGVTVHSFAGIGLRLESAEDLATKIRKNRKASSRWLRTKVLIIDEISMIDGDLFDKLARIGSLLRRQVKPFGGIQVIITGDFFQLPPVTKGKPLKFAFEADLWGQTLKRTIRLTKVFRQKDQDFVDMLNEMRFGTLSQKSINRFKSLSRDIIYEDGIHPTELFPRRQDVENSNNLRMSRLQGESRTFYAKDGGTAPDEQRRKLLDNFMAPDTLFLTVGAQVMLTKNVDETLVNGSMGIVQRFVDPAKYASEANDAEFILSGGKPPSGAGAKKPVVGSGIVMPLVEFNTPGGGRRPILVLPESWKIELPNGEVQASRQQLPLILSWAMSIHKSQGQTLDRVKVDLAKVFEKGQAYVALSRATSLDGLQVLNFSPDKVFIHEKVRDWSKTLETIEDFEE